MAHTWLRQGVVVKARRPFGLIKRGDVGTVLELGPLWDGRVSEIHAEIRLVDGSVHTQPVIIANNLWEPV